MLRTRNTSAISRSGIFPFVRAEIYAALRRPDVYLSLAVRSLCAGRIARVSVPETADEKFLWRKVFDRNPLFPVVSDKLAAKDWVLSLNLDLEIPRTLWVGSDPNGIPMDLLGPETVLKANHASQTNLFIGQSPLDRTAIRALAHKWLKTNHGWRSYEWAYSQVARKIFVEELLPDGSDQLEEIKVYTFGRRIERVLRIRGRLGQRMTGQVWAPSPIGELEKLERIPEVASEPYTGSPPVTWSHAMNMARALGAYFDHARIDFLTNGDRLWFNEVTLYNLCGTMVWNNHAPSAQIARAWDIRRSHFLQAPPRDGWRKDYAEALGRCLDRAAAEESPLPPA